MFISIVRVLNCALLPAMLSSGQVPPDCGERATATLRIEPEHPWRPPFGMDRIGRPVEVAAELTLDGRPFREYTIVALRGGREAERQVLHLTRSKPPYIGRARLMKQPDELVLLAQCRYGGKPEEVARQKLLPAAFEAEASARPEEAIHPADLNAIFVPGDWLLIPAGQKAAVSIASISHDRPLDVVAKAWFASNRTPVSSAVKLAAATRALSELIIPGPAASAGSRDVLHVSIEGGGRELWRKQIPAMVGVKQNLPAFGAVETKLDYPLPISVREPATGTFSTLKYEEGWRPELKDVVVRMPNGGRFVFWRGSSYIPFWVGAHGTGLSYEWAETTPPADGFVDSVEPLMDKELRYGRVRIVESTPARVHVQWEYQSTDFQYKVWGDSAVEDYYFYPDGFGSRVLTLKSAPDADYELSEFIILTPPSTYPLDVVPRNTVDMLFTDGEKKEVLFPPPGATAQQSYLGRKLENPRKVPIMYRVRIHRDDAASAIYFNPADRGVPMLFNPFFDRGELVTPGYWGSHWPLARGNTTGATIDDRITLTPSHNSMMTWGMGNRPQPLSRAEIMTPDALGRSRTMLVQKWAWLIGMTAADDAELLAWAGSFGTPASLEVKGGRLDLHSWAMERRAYRLAAEGDDVQIGIQPTAPVINPVFEISSARRRIGAIQLNGSAVAPDDYRWDGRTLWLRARVNKPSTLALRFAE